MGMESFGTDVPQPDQQTDMVVEGEKSIEGDKAECINSLKPKALDIATLYLPGLNINTDSINMEPFTYAENNGVIIFADEHGSLSAIPASAEVRESFAKVEIAQVEGVPVPSLSDGNVWGTELERSNSREWFRWKELVGSPN